MGNIVLIGMSGSGKTTIGERLAEKLSMKFTDTDEMIEKKEGRKIKDIFAENGERYFRDLETEIAISASKLENHIISTGGGMVLRDKNMQCFKENSVIIYLKRSVESIKKTMDASNRPLLKSGLAELNEMEKERAPIYEKYADLIVLNEADPEKAINEIINNIIN